MTESFIVRSNIRVCSPSTRGLFSSPVCYQGIFNQIIDARLLRPSPLVAAVCCSVWMHLSGRFCSTRLSLQKDNLTTALVADAVLSDMTTCYQIILCNTTPSMHKMVCVFT